MPGRRPCRLWARWVRALVRVAVSLRGGVKKLVRVTLIKLRNENTTKAAYIKDDQTGKKIIGNQVYVLVGLRPFQERNGLLLFFPARK